MRCTKCKTENSKAAQFCRQCGETLSDERKVRRVGVVIFAVCVVAGLTALVLVFWPGRSETSTAVATATSAEQTVHIGVAYGTEKEAWLTWAASEFAKTSAGANIKVDLKPMGSIEAANAIVKDDPTINVWAPASGLYKQVFLRDWATRHGQVDPIVKETPLVMSPMVLVMWQERFDAFRKNYAELNFKTIGQAIYEKGGWATIAQKPEWMFFKFSHTNPNQSNSGLIALMLMGYDYHDKPANLDGGDITNPQFQSWLMTIERNLIGAASGLVNSTGNLMTSMLQRGPSTYDCVLVYESNAIERLRAADARWGAIKIVYPKYNYMNDNPYYVLNVPWSSPEQRQAANAFGSFLLTREVQARAMADGFRPASPAVSISGSDSPWSQFAGNGLEIRPTSEYCESPNADVIENLLLCWQRSQAGK